MAKQTYLLYIEPSRLFFYVGASGAVLQVPVPWEIMHDMEIVDKNKFATLLQIFIKNNAIVPGSLALALSPQITFEATIPAELTSEQQKELLQKFLDTVPFQNVASQLGKLDNTSKVIAANKDLIEFLRNAFEKEKFTVPLAIPVSALQVAAPELQTNLDMGTILNKADLVHQYNLIAQAAPAALQQNSAKAPEQPPLKNKQTLALLGVFGALMVVLIIMVFTVLIPQSKPVKRTPQTALPAVPTPTPVSIATPSGQLTSPVKPAITNK